MNPNPNPKFFIIHIAGPGCEGTTHARCLDAEGDFDPRFTRGHSGCGCAESEIGLGGMSGDFTFLEAHRDGRAAILNCRKS
jgi:hypothetical protein